MLTHSTHTHWGIDHPATRDHRAFWLALIVALIVLLMCTGLEAVGGLM